MNAALLALALAVAAPGDSAAPGPADAPSPSPAVEGSPAATVRAPPPDDEAAASIAPDVRQPDLSRPGMDHHGWRHALALGPHSTTFFSREGSQYTFHSASLGYLGSVGAFGAFLHAFLLMPLQARQDGHVYATGNYYRTRSGGDLMTGPEWRFSFRGAEAEVGPGLHGSFIYLPGKQGFADFTALPLGLGAAAVVSWETRAERLSRAVTVGTYAGLAYDFWDPMHAGDLAHGFTFRVGAIVGLGGRR